MLRKEQLERVRFSLDEPVQYGFQLHSEQDSSGQMSDVYARFLTRHVQISADLFPDLFKTVEHVANLLIPNKEFSAFISADETLNALCMSADRDMPLIWLSSGLVKALSQDELSFVIGHEVGHWLFDHSLYPNVDPSGEARFLARQQLSRAAEISCDRIGLVACGKLELALRAILKTASGLDDRFIGNRVSEFVDQLSQVPISRISHAEALSSHPPMPLRARALIWFSMSDAYLDIFDQASGATSIDLVNSRVEKDLVSLLGAHYADDRNRHLEDALLWITLHEMSRGGSLTKLDQSLIDKEFGPLALEKSLQFFGGKGAARIKEETLEKAIDARKRLSSYPKRYFENAITEKKEVTSYVERFLARVRFD